MRFWSRSKKKTSRTRGSVLGLETLESRELLSANTIAIQSGETARFIDSDGTRVSIKLVGPGQGTLDLTNGQVTGGDIENLTLTGTNGNSRLTIATKGGSIAGAKINQLVIEKAANEVFALGRFEAISLDFVDGGQFSADGSITDIALRDVGEEADIDIAGSVQRFRARAIDNDATINIAGALRRFAARTIDDGARLSAAQIDELSVRSAIRGATIDVGAGGIGKANLATVSHSVIASQGSVSRVIVAGNLTSTSFASNINMGSDGIYGTIDDWVIDPAASGNIGSVKIRGRVDAGTTERSAFVASGDIGPVSVTRSVRNRGAVPVVWAEAASQNIPLVVNTTAINAHGFANSEIWVAIFGEEIPTPPPGVSLTGPTYFLDPSTIANGAAHRTLASTLNPPNAGTPNLVTLPSATLATWQNALNLHAPSDGNQFTGRILISVGAPVQAQINSDGSVSAPSAANPSDPSNGTFYDFLEFTVTNKKGTISLDIDTSQVDSFGMPIGLQFFKDTSGTPFNISFSGATTANGDTISGITDTTGLAAGQPVYGTALPPEGAIILSVTASTTKNKKVVPGSVKLNRTTTLSPSSSFTAYAAGPVGVKTPRDVIVSGATDHDLYTYIAAKVAHGDENARPFLQTAAPYPRIAPTPITGAAGNAIVITTNSTAGLHANDTVLISGVEGNTTANGLHTVSAVTSNSFTLTGINSNGTYTQGGTWAWPITNAAQDPSNPGPIVIHTGNTAGLQNGDLVEISGVKGNTAANGFFFINDVQPTSFRLAGSHQGNAYTGGGTWKVYTQSNRLVSPKDIVESLPNAQDTNELNNYFNEAIDAFFLKYYTGPYNGGHHQGETFRLISQASGSSIVYSGTVGKYQITTSDGSVQYDGYMLRLNAESGGDKTNYDIIYPFFNSNLPDSSVYTPIFTPAAPPTWLNSSQQAESASQMIFACDALFADNIARGLSGNPGKILGDLENSISAAFNRGITQSNPLTWWNMDTWFPTGGAYNYWVEFWHQYGLTYSDLAYAFPYDDKFGTSTNLNQNSVGQATITLGSWSNTRFATTTTLQNFPPGGTLGGAVQLEAKVLDHNSQPMTTGSVNFYINGASLNPNDSSASPPLYPVALNSSGIASLTATLPAMPDGNIPHTYTVTAVYSGDNGNLPSIDYKPLQLTESFSVGFNPGTTAIGDPVQFFVTLGGASYAGELTFTIAHADGTGQQVLGTLSPSSFTPQPTYNIPTDLLTLTGDIQTTSGVTYIQNVSSFVNLVTGQILSNSNLKPQTSFSHFQMAQLTLSKPANTSGTVEFVVNGRKFIGQIPADNLTNVNGIITLAGLSQGDSITSTTPGALKPGTTIDTPIPGWIKLDKTSIQDATGQTITSNAAGSSFPITVSFKPTGGHSISVTSLYGIVKA